MTRSSRSPQSLLHLAALYGVQVTHYDITHRRRSATREELLHVLGALGAPISRAEEAPAALRQRRLELQRQVVEPVAVAWDGEAAPVEVRLPKPLASASMDCTLVMEDGGERRWRWMPAETPPLHIVELEGETFTTYQSLLPDGLPQGYHQLFVEIAGKRWETLVISAPQRAYTPWDGVERKAWGAFLPLYALYSQHSWGIGDFSDLERLAGWIGELGGEAVATLPLLPVYLEEANDPSPYAPVSRLFWNEIYLDVARTPGPFRPRDLQDQTGNERFLEEAQRLRQSPLVDYQKVTALKRRALERLAEDYFARPIVEQQSLREFQAANPLVEEYARFRGAVRAHGLPWRSWGQRLHQGDLRPGDWDEKERRYHLYTQWMAFQQMEAVTRSAMQHGVRLYLDFPVGVHPEGFDAWKHQSLFAKGVSVGAPPDLLFAHGQDWGFQPFHPEELRRQGYRYYRDSLRHHLKNAGVLRIDHVMGLHRLFWVPEGRGPEAGVYVRYRPEELYAIIALESHRHMAMVVGEDLGTVPPEVRPAMARHGVQRMHVLPFEVRPSHTHPVRPTPRGAVASVNTHDMPTFAAFWGGLDIAMWKERGTLDQRQAQREREARKRTADALQAYLQRRGMVDDGDSAEAVHAAVIRRLASRQAGLTLVNLEDLWGETEPQNIPGTGHEAGNWRRRAKLSFEEFCDSPQVVQALRSVDKESKRPPR